MLPNCLKRKRASVSTSEIGVSVAVSARQADDNHQGSRTNRVVQIRVSGLFFAASVYSWFFLVFFTPVENRESLGDEVTGE